MKAVVLGLLCVVAFDVFAGVFEAAKLALREGALGKYTYRVVAHYGKIYGPWKSTSFEMLLSDGCFNLVENDTNIEGDQTLLHSIRNYEHHDCLWASKR